MFRLTEVKPDKITDKYFPVALVQDEKSGTNSQKKPIYIEEMDYKLYAEDRDKLLKLYIKEEDDRDLIADLIDQGKLPRNAHQKFITKKIVSVLDEKYKREYKVPNGKVIRKTPNVMTRDAINVYGAANSGKTYWTAEEIRTYKKSFPKRDIYLITTNSIEDPTYKGLGLKKLDLSDRKNIDELMDSEDGGFDETSFENSLVVFDDIESQDKALYAWIRDLRDTLFMKARKHETDIINIIHKALDRNLTKVPNLEANGCVVFPRLSWPQAKKTLSVYYDISQKQLDEIYRLRNESRWVYVSKQYPKYVLWEKGVKLLD